MPDSPSRTPRHHAHTCGEWGRHKEVHTGMANDQVFGLFPISVHLTCHVWKRFIFCRKRHALGPPKYAGKRSPDHVSTPQTRGSQIAMQRSRGAGSASWPSSIRTTTVMLSSDDPSCACLQRGAAGLAIRSRWAPRRSASPSRISGLHFS